MKKRLIKQMKTVEEILQEIQLKWLGIYRTREDRTTQNVF